MIQFYDRLEVLFRVIYIISYVILIYFKFLTRSSNTFYQELLLIDRILIHLTQKKLLARQRRKLHFFYAVRVAFYFCFLKEC